MTNRRCPARSARGDADTPSVAEPLQEVERILDHIIAHGTTDDDGYGPSPAERARFIVDTIRVHLARAACEVHSVDLTAIGSQLGHPVEWCPSCGARIAALG